MPMELTETAAVLEGVCEVAEAEALLSWLQSHPQGRVDITRCAHLHTAILQVLMAAGPTLVGADGGTDARPWLALLRPAATDRQASARRGGSTTG